MKTEVLAPAGSKEGVYAVIAAGADAVYAGGKRFGARSYAENLSDAELSECIDYCHLHGRRLYLTVNTLFKESEIAELYDWIAPFYERGLDAAIVQDLGVFAFLKREFPLLDIHASTQMTVHSAAGARFLEELGAARVVPARELSLEEIHEIRKRTGLEIECFVHGALCYSYSGQCLMSSLIGARSGNRGRCAQPCRLPWSYDGGEEQFLLSPRDICTLNILPDILEAGVDSLKIEGRMKRVEYAAGVSAIYRKYVDLFLQKGRKYYRVEQEDICALMDLYNRGGFSEGYYQNDNGAHMMSTKRQNHCGTPGAKLLGQSGGQTVWVALEPLSKGDILESVTLEKDVCKGQTFTLKLKEKQKLLAGTVWNRTFNAPLIREIRERYMGRRLQEKLNGKLMIFPDKPAILDLILGEHRVHISGADVQRAQKRPLLEETVRKQMCRTKDAPYLFERLDIRMGGDCFLALGSLNELRREGMAAMEREVLRTFRRKIPSKPGMENRFVRLDEEMRACAGRRDEVRDKPAFCVSLENLGALSCVAEFSEVDRIYLDSKCFKGTPDEDALFRINKLRRQKSRKIWYIMPSVFRDRTAAVFRKRGMGWLSCFDGILIKNLEELVFLRENGYQGTVAADYNLYTCNREADRLLAEYGVDFSTCPVEMNLRELSERGCRNGELFIYGRLPLMVSAQCLQKTSGACTNVSGLHRLRDRRGKIFPVRNCCEECLNVIYNCVPLSLHGMAKEVRRLSPAAVRLSFTVESVRDTRKITESFLEEYVSGRRPAEADYEFTRGHYKRGVE